MANLHKTEKKLPWLVRDGGLASDWLGGRIGGILCSHTVNLCGMPDTAETHTYTPTHIFHFLRSGGQPLAGKEKQVTK